jgi:DNA polymerase-3 subunit delta
MAKKSLAPVYALVGNEPFLQRQAVEEILGRSGPDVQRADVDGATAEPADVFDELRSLAMFGGRRVVIVRDAEQFITRHRPVVEGYLQSPAQGNVLILRCTSLPKNQKVYKLAAKAGEVIACEPPKAGGLARWITSHGKSAHRLTVAPAAAALLADLIGSDLGSLDGELAKLALQADDGRVVPDMIAGGVAFRREQQMWAMTDALTRGDSAGGLRIWRQLLATDDSAEFRAVTWLGIWLEKADGALGLMEQGVREFEIAKRLRIWPADNVRPLLDTAHNLGRHGIRRATDRLVELDYRNKVGLGDARRATEAFIVSVAGNP